MIMSYFAWGTIVLFLATAIFYAVFASLVYYWHEKKTTVLVVPLIYTFDFFIISFMVVFPVVLLLEYLPEILKFIETY